MAKPKSKADRLPVIENRRARFDYEILDTLEVGIKLTGPEVKSVRAGKVSLAEGYVRVQADPPELHLHSVHIAEYAPAGAHQHPNTRTRLLLAHKKEILKLARQVEVKGVTIIPLKMYFSGPFAKVLIALGKGRGKADKRHHIAKRDAQRDIARATSHRA